MGTHDLDKIKGPIKYVAKPPKDIVFQALKQKDSMNAVDLFNVFRTDNKMKKFLPIIEDFDKYPVFYDANGQVLSLPPIINSEATKITMDTKNVFVEITGTDPMKCKTCLAIIAAQFSEHCAGEWRDKVEQVKIIYEGETGADEITPSMEYLNFDIELEYINRILGVQIDAAKVRQCAEKMGLSLSDTSSDGQVVKIEVPPTRSDILHKCDLIEDVGIGYGFNNIARVFPENNTVGTYQPDNKFTDSLRAELAQAGYVEQLTFSLVSFKDNYDNMRRRVDPTECVVLTNPKTVEFEIVRTSLLPCLLKMATHTKKEPIPQKFFEISDICVLDPASETGAKNSRKVAAITIDQTSSFEVIHGLLDLIMTKVGADFSAGDYSLSLDEKDPRFLPTKGVEIKLRGTKIGSMGILHPEVLGNFELKYPITCIELDFDPLFDNLKNAKK